MKPSQLICALASVAVVVMAAGCDPGAQDLPPDDVVSGVLFINEFMAENDTAVADPDGTGGFPDWIELYNAGDRDMDLGGMFLTDDLLNPTQWRVPAGVVIPARGYLLFWADNDEEQGDTHTNFALNSGGEAIGLFDTVDNGIAAIDTIVFGGQTPDVSFGRLPDGSENGQVLAQSTPGQSNGNAPN